MNNLFTFLLVIIFSFSISYSQMNIIPLKKLQREIESKNNLNSKSAKNDSIDNSKLGFTVGALTGRNSNISDNFVGSAKFGFRFSTDNSFITTGIGIAESGNFTSFNREFASYLQNPDFKNSFFYLNGWYGFNPTASLFMGPQVYVHTSSFKMDLMDTLYSGNLWSVAAYFNLQYIFKGDDSSVLGKNVAALGLNIGYAHRNLGDELVSDNILKNKFGIHESSYSGLEVGLFLRVNDVQGYCKSTWFKKGNNQNEINGFTGQALSFGFEYTTDIIKF